MPDFGSLALLLVAGVAGLALLEALIARPWLVAGLILTLGLVHAVIDPPTASIGPLTVTLRDVLTVMVGAAAVARLLRLRSLATEHRLLLLLAAVLAVALVRGALAFGVPTALNESRGMLPFVAAALYFSTVTPTPTLLDRIGKYWLAAAAALVGLSLLRWGAPLIGLPSWEFLQPSASRFRVIASSEALIVAQGLVLALLMLKAAPHVVARRAAVVTLLGVTIFLEHRTVWVVTLVTFAVLVLRDRDLGRRLAIAVSGGIALAGVTIFAFFPGAPPAAIETLEASATNTGTLDWRIQGWVDLLSGEDTFEPLNAAVGQPFGTGYEREVEGSVRTSSPHSYYVQSFLRTGFVGLACVLALYLLALRRHRRVDDEGGEVISANALFALLVGHLVYYLAYGSQFEQGILFGLALGGVLASVRSRRTARPVVPTLIPRR